ncbi:MAG: 4-alpha-glucanotransferase [Lachnospiraceae bacterium]|nr:4-alpha-glucanotransferase [Lachnospiraceae bacterium]
MRRSGILLSISGLPSRFGIGGFSKEAYGFVDFLKEAGQKVWQILPLGPTGYGDSPYQSFSTFAGNPYFIDLEALIEEGLLQEEECSACDVGGSEEYVDYEKIYYSRFPLLRLAYERAFTERGFAGREDYRKFVEENAFWLEDYALYMAIKDSRGGRSFTEWEEDVRLRRPKAMAECREKYQADIEFYRYLQYLFAVQWNRLKSYANERGIQIVGDIPIYVSMDSADVWAGPELFQLGEDGLPKAVAGCPPDAFSATGQLWGNPLYDWQYHRENGFAWWIRRLAHCFRLYDIVRIDHFRGFDEYWSIPYGDPTAENGKWVKGPGYELFETMKRELGDRPVIAEDLGFLTESVLELVARTGYPGMKVLQFAFDSEGDSDYLPHNYHKNCVVYTGTHDNDTTAGWYRQLSERVAGKVHAYLDLPICGAPEQKEEWTTVVIRKLVRAAFASAADTAIILLQDYLELGSEARVNTPSTLGDNWKWRMKVGACTPELAEKIKGMTRIYGR